jgi:hypothetical protein
MNQKLDEKLAQESNVSDKKELLVETSRVIQTTPNLTLQQREQLKVLKKDIRANLNDLKSQSLRLRAVLVKDVISSQDHADEIELIKKRLHSVEDQRLKVVFSAVERANGILGKTAPDHEQVMREFFNESPGVSKE